MNNKIILLVFIFLLVSGVVAAVPEDVQEVIDKASDFIDDPENILIVEGEYASPAERIALDYLQENYPEIAAVQVVQESEFSEEDAEGKTLLLIGGPHQNSISADLLSDPNYDVDHDRIGPGIVTFLTSDEGIAIVVSDYKGHDNLAQTAAAKSPLAKIMPVAAVPAAATAIGFILLLIWQYMVGLFPNIVKRKIIQKVMSKVKKREFKHKFHGFHLFGIRFKYREAIAVLIASSVFAISLSYMYLSPQSKALTFFLITVIVNFTIYGARNLARIVVDRIYGMHTEYTIWYWGVLVTTFTAWLGNTFSLAGYIIKGHEKDVVHEGKIAFVINFVTLMAFAAFFAWNYFNPSVVAQIAMLLSLAIVYLETLPIKPFSGRNIYLWKKWVWWISFIPLTAVYLFINLII